MMRGCDEEGGGRGEEQEEEEEEEGSEVSSIGMHGGGSCGLGRTAIGLGIRVIFWRVCCK